MRRGWPKMLSRKIANYARWWCIQRVLPVLAILLLPACVDKSYLGVSNAKAELPPNMQRLVERARRGDKHAQLELGIRLEEGRGVRRNLSEARHFYALAASDDGGPTWVYVPSPGGRSPARVLPGDSGRRQLGLPEAKLRLEMLKEIKEVK